MDQETKKILANYVMAEKEAREGLLAQVTALEAQNRELIEKTAVADVPAERYAKSVKQLIAIGELNPKYEKACIEKMANDRTFVLDCLEKLAEKENERLLTPAPLGRSKEAKEESKGQRTKSVDAWDEAVTDLKQLQRK